MSGFNYYSDYGSLSSSNSSSTWPTFDNWPNQTNLRPSRSEEQTSASFQDLVMGRCTLEDIMKDFQMNGSDAPYNPDEESAIWGNLGSSVSGGWSGSYMRQKSWPAPDSSPAQRLPRTEQNVPVTQFIPAEFASTSTPIEEPGTPTTLTDEQLRVLSTLPNTALFALLQELEVNRDGYRRVKRMSTECRFCKNNGERESYYRSHSLKDGAGRVSCPVLRAFVCARCGARGDSAHTIKYCPLSTADERLKSAAMLRSVRLASGRRRAVGSAHTNTHYNMLGENAQTTNMSDNTYNSYALSSPLDPRWAALEQKLLS